MIKHILLVLCAMIWAMTISFAGETEVKKETPPDVSEEDMEIINHLEILEMMEMAKHFQLLNDLDILIEEDPDEKNN